MTAPQHHGSRGSRILLAAVSVLIVAIIVVGAFVVPAVRNTNRTVSSGARSDKIAACARQLHATVDQANADLQVSIARTLAASTDLNGITVAYVHAVKTGDLLRQRTLIDQATAAVQVIRISSKTMRKNAAEAVSATNTYTGQADLSYRNPTQFLVLCKRKNS